STLTLFNLWFVLLGLSENLGLAGDKDDGEFIGESFPGTGDFHVVFDLNRCRCVLDRSPVSEVSLLTLSKLAIQHAGSCQQSYVASMKGSDRVSSSNLLLWKQEGHCGLPSVAGDETILYLIERQAGVVDLHVAAGRNAIHPIYFRGAHWQVLGIGHHPGDGLPPLNRFVSIVVVPDNENGALVVLFRLLADQAVDSDILEPRRQRIHHVVDRVTGNDHQQDALGLEPRIRMAEKQLFHAL